MSRGPPGSTRPATLFLYPTLFRGDRGDRPGEAARGCGAGRERQLVGHRRLGDRAARGELIHGAARPGQGALRVGPVRYRAVVDDRRSEEHTSELQSLMRISYAVFCLKKKKQHTKTHTT